MSYSGCIFEAPLITKEEHLLKKASALRVLSYKLFDVDSINFLTLFITHKTSAGELFYYATIANNS